MGNFIEDLDMEHFIWRTPEDCTMELRNMVIDVRKRFLNSIEIFPKSLYVVLETENEPARAFQGSYLLDPAISFPSVKETKEQSEWIEKQNRMSKRKMVDHISLQEKRKKFDADDLYESYLKKALNMFRLYVSDVQNHIMYGSEAFEFASCSPALLHLILDREKKELGRLNAIRSDYIGRDAPSWLRSQSEREAYKKAQLISLIDRYL